MISPQSWGKMQLSKHHYAKELARRGNQVYFLNPPESKKSVKAICISSHETVPNLYLVRHCLFFPAEIKFKWKSLFHFLMKFHIQKLRRSLRVELDIILNFDLGDYYRFEYFGPKPLKIFFPVDEPLNRDGIESASSCEIIFSVSKEILEKYAAYDVPKHFTHHGLAEEFIESKVELASKNENIHIGLSGNWMRADIDVDCLTQIIRENPTVIFEFWGAFKAKDSNIGGGSDDMAKILIDFLKKTSNVVLHGVVEPQILAKEFQRMDGFLICYDILKDHSRGTNYHKVMEYLSTGKVVISNNITTYNNIPGLLEMSKSREDNKELPTIFRKVISQISVYNDINRFSIRKQFALGNSYELKITEIEKVLSSQFK